MRTAAAATALGITLSIAALASCAESGPDMPRPSPSVTPVFASEEEALAAAEAAYQWYLDVSNAIAQAGWVDTSALETVEHGDALENERETGQRYAEAGYLQTGTTTFDSLSVQQIEDLGVGRASIIAYLCLDVSGTDVLDAQGVSVVTEDRPPRQALEVEFDDSDGEFEINRSDVWSGNDFC